MREGYTIENNIFAGYKFFYIFNFLTINTVSNYGFLLEYKEYNIHEDSIGVWKIKSK